jgi:hypothetical protein
MSEIKNRIGQLENQIEESGGRCPECGFAPGDIRYLLMAVQNPENPEPFMETGRGGGDKLPLDEKDLCSTCGGILPPIRTFIQDPDTGVITEERFEGCHYPVERRLSP